MGRLVLVIFLFSILWFACEPQYTEKYLYIAVVGDYGIPFHGSYGNRFDQFQITSSTPDYYYFRLREFENDFYGSFWKANTVKKDFRELTVRLYLKKFTEPASLLVEISHTDPDSVVTVDYRD